MNANLKIIICLGLFLICGTYVWTEEAAEAEAEPAAQEQDTEAANEAEAEPEEEIKVPPRGQMGMVEIMTTPEKATVYLGGEELGLSPIEKREFPSGRHDFTIMLGGEELVKERVNVWPNQTLSLERKLTMPYGTIILTTKPGHTKVYVDGEEVGRTTGGPLTINNVSAGSHIVKVTARKRRSREVEININGEDTAKVDIRL